MDNGCNITNTTPPPGIDWSKILKKCFPGFNEDDLGISKGPNKNTEISLKFLFYFLAITTNILLLYTMYKDPLKRFRNSTSFFIINLTIADLLSIVSGICFAIYQVRPATRGELDQKRTIASCFDGIGIQCSFLIVMTFAMDRYIAIAHPYAYRNIIEKKLILIILIILPWCFAVIALPVTYFAKPYDEGRTLTRLYAGDIIALVCVTLVVHPVTHWEFKKKIRELERSSYTNKQIMEENLNIAKVLTTTVLMVSLGLIIFMSPYLAAYIFDLTGCNKCYLNPVFLSLWKYYPLLMSTRFITNSLVYAWRLPLYRTSLKVLIPLKCLNIESRTSSRNRIGHFPREIVPSSELNAMKKQSSHAEPSQAAQIVTSSRDSSTTNNPVT